MTVELEDLSLEALLAKLRAKFSRYDEEEDSLERDVLHSEIFDLSRELANRGEGV
jgi:RNA-binding protein YlmH